MLVPEAVLHEVAVVGAGMPGADEVRNASWLTVVAPTRRDLVDALSASGLHSGESVAIALAVERTADVLLIDERQGRATAEGMGIHVLCTLGVLVAAKRRGDIDAVAPAFEALRASGLWLSLELVRRILAAVGEAP